VNTVARQALQKVGRAVGKAVWTAARPYVLMAAGVVIVVVLLLGLILAVLHGPSATTRATLLQQARSAAAGVISVKSFDGEERQFAPDAVQLAVISWDAQQAGTTLSLATVARGMAPTFQYGTAPDVLRVLESSGVQAEQVGGQVQVVVAAQTVQGKAFLHYTESTQQVTCPAKWPGFTCVRQVPHVASVSWTQDDSPEIALFHRWFPGQNPQDMIKMVEFEAQRWMGLDAISLGLPIYLKFGLAHAVLHWRSFFDEYATPAVPAQLLAAVTAQESGGNPNALSSAGAEGLMQVVPAKTGLRSADMFDANANVHAGSAFLNELADSYDLQPGCVSQLVSNPTCQTALELTLAAYNAGPGNVALYGGVPPFPETIRYIRRVEGFLADFTSA